MKNTKLTYSQALTMVLEVEEIRENEELFNKITQLDNQLNKKSGKQSKAEQEKQRENDGIKSEILTVMGTSPHEAKSIKELQLKSDLLITFSNQKISALIRQLIANDEVERMEEKRIAKFFKPEN